MPAGLIERLAKSEIVDSAELSRLRAIEMAALGFRETYAAQSPPRGYEAALLMTLCDAILAGKGPNK